MALITVRNSLRESSNANIKSLWEMTSSVSSNVICDSTFLKNISLDDATKAIKLESVNQAFVHVKMLTIQSMPISSIVNSIKPSQITAWTSEVNRLPATLYNFTRKALQQQLPTKSNRHHWCKTTTPTCALCNKIQTNKHVLTNYASTHALDWYKVRHDAVLHMICAQLQGVKVGGLTRVDYMPLDVLFQNLRPAIAIVQDNSIPLLELTTVYVMK